MWQNQSFSHGFEITKISKPPDYSVCAVLCFLSSYPYLSTVRVTEIAIDATQEHSSMSITLAHKVS